MILDKVKVALFLTLCLITFSTKAQTGVYGSFSLGGNIPTAAPTFNNFSTLGGSYAGGLKAQVRLGAYLHENSTIDLSLGYQNSTNQNILDSSLFTVNGQTQSWDLHLAFNQYLTHGLYIRGGVIANINSKIDLNGSITGFSEIDNIDYSRINEGKVSWGMLAGAGYNLRIGDNLALFAEVQYNAIDISLKKSTYGYAKYSNGFTESEVNTIINNNPYLSSSQKYYIKSLITSQELIPGEEFDGNTFEEYDIPFPSIGLTFGVSYIID